jgi:hypothetical protein
MAKITVYHYELADPFSGTAIRSRSRATRRAIDAAGGKLLADTAQEVEVRFVSDDGIAMPYPVDKAPPPRENA